VINETDCQRGWRAAAAYLRKGAKEMLSQAEKSRSVVCIAALRGGAHLLEGYANGLDAEALKAARPEEDRRG
jgi:hypothetical protein